MLQPRGKEHLTILPVGVDNWMLILSVSGTRAEKVGQALRPVPESGRAGKPKTSTNVRTDAAAGAGVPSWANV